MRSESTDVTEDSSEHCAEDSVLSKDGEVLLDPEHHDAAMRMAFSLLKRWRCQLNREDVEGMAGVALCRAAQQFDPSLGTKFESYLFYYVRAELIKAIEESVHARKAIEALRDVVPDNDAKIENTSSTDSSGPTLPDPDRIGAATAPTPEGRMLHQEQAEQVRQALNRLEENHRTILQLVYFEQVHPQQLREQLGLTRSGIRRALENAKRALKKELQRVGCEGILPQ